MAGGGREGKARQKNMLLRERQGDEQNEQKEKVRTSGAKRGKNKEDEKKGRRIREDESERRRPIAAARVVWGGMWRPRGSLYFILIAL